MGRLCQRHQEILQGESKIGNSNNWTKTLSDWEKNWWCQREN